MSRINKKFVLASHFQGEPKLSDIQLIEEQLPELKDGGQFILKIDNSYEQFTLNHGSLDLNGILIEFKL